MKPDDGVTVPALWEVSREGHNWVNTDERFDAFDNLLQWIFYGTFITVRKVRTTLHNTQTHTFLQGSKSSRSTTRR